MKKLLFIFLTMASFSTFALDNSSSSTNEKIQATLDKIRIQNNAPAMQVSVSLPGEYASRNFVSGTTEMNGKTNITTDSLFQIGSNTKAFVSVIILQLEAQGKLSIDDPIDKYIDFSKHPTWPSKWKNITIKQLLNMTSGIFSYTDDQNFSNEVINNPNIHFTATQLVNIAASHPDDFSPGTSWNYSNTDYILVGKIIQNLTGKTVTQLMYQKLLGSTQYNLDNTYYEGSQDYSENINARAVGSYLNINGKIQDVSSKGLSWANAAGSMLSTGSDMTRWVRALFSGPVLKPQQLNEMESLVCTDETPVLGCKLGQPVNNDGYGLGLYEKYDTNNNIGKVWLYEGQTFGTTSVYAYIPSYNTVIYVAGDYVNNERDYVGDLMNQILSILLQSHSWQKYRETHEMTPIDASQLNVTIIKFPKV